MKSKRQILESIHENLNDLMNLDSTSVKETEELGNIDNDIIKAIVSEREQEEKSSINSEVDEG